MGLQLGLHVPLAIGVRLELSVPLELYIGAVLATIPIAAAVGAVAWRNRPRSGAHWLAMLNAGVVVWLSAIVASYVAEPKWLSLLLVKVQYVGIVTTIMAVGPLTLAFIRRDDLLTRRTLALLAVEPIVVLLAVWMNPVGVFYQSVPVSTTNVSGIDPTYGPVFWLHVVYSYAVLGASVVLLVREVLRSDRIYRFQAAAMIVAVLAPWFGNFLYLTDVSPIDLTPVGFAVSGTALLWAIYRYRLTEVAPIARDTLVDNIRDGVFVIDDDGRVVDINPTGEEMLGKAADDVVGEHASDVFDAYPDILERYRDTVQVSDEVTLETEYGPRHFEVDISPLEDDAERRVGRLIVVHDVTERKRREQELHRQNDQLERFASFLSHDLRNPLNVADGYLQTVKDTGDLEYLEEVERSHERMEQLIEEALTLAREGQTIDEVEAVALDDLAWNAWENVDTAEATLSVDTNATILADRSRVLRLLENCFRNAVEHGGRSVGVRVGTFDPDAIGDGGIGFFVADDGPGFPLEQGDAVLEMGMTTSEDGTGLGLAIVESIAEAHGWRIDLGDSEAGGARIAFTGVGSAEPVDEDTAVGPSIDSV